MNPLRGARTKKESHAWNVEPVVFVISGDSKFRSCLSSRLKRLGCEARLCHSPAHFQQISSPQDAGCVLLHVDHAPADLVWLTALGGREAHWPVIGMAADADVETAVRAMKQGAFDFLLEKCSDQRLRAAVAEAFCRDAAQRKLIRRVQSLRRRMKQLAPPVRDVLELLVEGKSNGEIADQLRLSVRTIEVRRAKIMKIMKADNLVALVRQVLLTREDSRPPQQENRLP